VLLVPRATQAVSQLPDVFARMREERRKFPEASTFSFFWASVEDLILQACLDRALEEPVQNVSSSSTCRLVLRLDHAWCRSDWDCQL
jgi:hypothetical protein